ncbi:MAG: histidine phosphatase family protein [Treponema sp.]|nr:histidine phosphatase family protein [Treponema sp.]
MDEAHRAADAAFFSDLGRDTDFYLIRHGESEGNARLVMQGLLDLPLNPRGEAQAEAAGAWLADKGVSRLYSSPLRRALRTAELIAARANLPAPRPDPVFTELDTGLFTGLSVPEIREQHPEVYREFRARSWDAVPGAESSASLYERALRAWEFLKARARETEGAVAVVSHGGCLQWMVRATFGCRTWMPLLTTGNCGVFHLNVHPNAPGRSAYLQWKLINSQPESGLSATPPVF